MAQAVECLPRKFIELSSSPSTTNKERNKRKEGERERERERERDQGLWEATEPSREAGS
jgi:hypothetical protein